MAGRKRRDEPPVAGDAGLGELEAKVREAAARLAELREENRTLRARVEELEIEAEAESADAGEDAAAAVPASDAGEEWSRERREIRRRVESLTETLEDLLG